MSFLTKLLFAVIQRQKAQKVTIRNLATLCAFFCKNLSSVNDFRGKLL